jgi:hypothetical protein
MRFVRVQLVALWCHVVAGVAAVLALQEPASTLRLVSTIWPPFTGPPGQSRLALDLVENALGRTGVTPTFDYVPNSEYTPALVSGPYSGSGAAWRDQQREAVLLYSEPYLENRLVLVARRGGNVSAQSLTALKGKRVAIVEGYAYGDIDSLGPVFVRSSSEENSISLLLGLAADYALMDELVIQYLVDHHPVEAKAKLQIGGTALLIRPLHLALRRSLPGAPAILERFNAQIRAMIVDRTYHRLLQIDWLRADVDGDGLVENVAATDRALKTEPQRAYRLFSSTAIEEQVKKEQERYFFGGAVYNGWSSVPDAYKVDHLDRPDHTHPVARVFSFNWK